MTWIQRTTGHEGGATCDGCGVVYLDHDPTPKFLTDVLRGLGWDSIDVVWGPSGLHFCPAAECQVKAASKRLTDPREEFSRQLRVLKDALQAGITTPDEVTGKWAVPDPSRAKGRR